MATFKNRVKWVSTDASNLKAMIAPEGSVACMEPIPSPVTPNHQRNPVRVELKAPLLIGWLTLTTVRAATRRLTLV